MQILLQFHYYKLDKQSFYLMPLKNNQAIPIIIIDNNNFCFIYKLYIKHIVLSTVAPTGIEPVFLP